jgi:hypothetical protein
VERTPGSSLAGPFYLTFYDADASDLLRIVRAVMLLVDVRSMSTILAGVSALRMIMAVPAEHVCENRLWDRVCWTWRSRFLRDGGLRLRVRTVPASNQRCESVRDVQQGVWSCEHKGQVVGKQFAYCAAGLTLDFSHHHHWERLWSRLSASAVVVCRRSEPL